ncbi:MAG TPA: flavodoxin [Candidatus Choladocola avistercoris]|nr:flavodoxin [Candidatus Choladocola avistercoris]
MKRFAAIVLSAVMALSLAACSSRDTSGTPDTGTDTAVQENASQPQESTAPETDAAQNILIAYFSNTGNTEEVAQQIADLTGGTLAEIQRAENYTDLQEEAEAEIQDGVRPEITVSVDNVEDYDTIFVGYPIWWDEAPAMIATFLESYDFSGKTLIPFCTSASDSIDNSLHIFSEICPDATIAEALTANDEADIEPWLQNLGLLDASAGETAASGSNILIAYFSVPETDGTDAVAGASRVVIDGEVLGNTQYLAQLIQEETGGDLFRIETVQEYPGSHDPLLEFAYNERAEGTHPELASQISGLENYDMIFLGYPNWNSDLPMPLYTFLESYDFSGKTIIPFTSHGGSGFSGTIGTISEMQPGADVLDNGFSVSRNNVADAQNDLADWILGLNIL